MTIAYQVETATVVGTITLAGNATVTVTGARITGSPVVVSVAVGLGDDASTVANIMRDALALNSAISNQYQVSGSGADIVLTDRQYRSNDPTLNIATDNDDCTGLTPEPNSTHTHAGEGLSNTYITLDQLKQKAALNITNNAVDDLLVQIINSVSRRIDARCGRYFYQSELQARRYTPIDHYRFFCDDIASLDGLILQTDWNGDGVYETTWTIVTDFTMEPVNAPYSSPAMPWTMIHRQLYGNYYFPSVLYGIQLTAHFGWPAIPDTVVSACLLQCERFYKRLQLPIGTTQMNAFGQSVVVQMNIPKLDPDVEDMLRSPYSKTV